LLVLRTNAGYERWWEGRKLWGAIVNQSRALATTALAYGPTDPGWSDRLVRWTAAYGHATRRSLRGQRDLPELVTLLGSESAEKVAKARHMPTFVSIEIAALLRIAYEQHGMDRLAFAQAESARCSLLDQTGGCERILKSPLPRAYGINIRRFILLFLITLPFSILDAVGWLTPVVAFLVAYPIMSLDEIGVELQNPFIVRNLGHLPLDEICATIEKDLLAIGSDRV
jgi:putative membrane protein